MFAFCNKKNQYIVWSNEKQRKRENIINDVRANFIDCVKNWMKMISCLSKNLTINTMMKFFSTKKNVTLWIYSIYAISKKYSFTCLMIDLIRNMTFVYSFLSTSTKSSKSFLTKNNICWSIMFTSMWNMWFFFTKRQQFLKKSIVDLIANFSTFASILNTRLICSKIVKSIWSNFVCVCTTKLNTNTSSNESRFASFFTMFF